MKKLLSAGLVALSLSLAHPLQAQPLLDCAERFLPAAAKDDSQPAYRAALAQAYAQHGSYAKAQALIDTADKSLARELGQRAAVGALKSGDVKQALKWAELYISPKEIAWDNEKALAHGSDREKLLQAATSPEAAEKVLTFLRARGGVSAQSLAFVSQNIGGLPLAVSDTYFRHLSKVADQLRPIDWAGIEEALEYSGDEFAPLHNLALKAIVEQREQLVQELLEAGLNQPELLDVQMRRYGALLLARRGRFEEASRLWGETSKQSLVELRLYLQNQYLGGRLEALKDLTAVSELEEDAKLDLSLFLLRLGKEELAKGLDVEPESYLDARIARRDLQRGINVSKWLDFFEQLDRGAAPEDSRLYELANDYKLSPEVQRQALSRIPAADELRHHLQDKLATELAELSQLPSERVTLQLLVLDNKLRELGLELSPENLKSLEEFCSQAPRP